LTNASQFTLVWDFNGTLLDDLQACLDALNVLLKSRQLTPVTRDYYRSHFGFPVINFYESLGLIPKDAEDWENIGESFHMRYLFSKHLKLQPFAAEAVAAIHALGIRQGVLSALEQGLLELQLSQFGLASQMDFIRGSRSYDGASKVGAAASLQLKGPVVLIGDTEHDAEVAKAQGWHCVLCSAGHHTAERLKQWGFPVIPTLHDLLPYLKSTFSIA
jgi:phosphoglycolate phosphatase